ncbi:hypothetical protein M9458_017856, partial [Cirrhinus mrigala]
MFETAACRERWARDEWARLLAPELTSRYRPEAADDYEELKKGGGGRAGGRYPAEGRAAISPEGGPGATHTGGHQATNEQAGGSPDQRRAHAPVDEPEPQPRAWLAGCTLHQEPPAVAPEVQVKVNGRSHQALLDSGSAVSLVQPKVISQPFEAKTYLPVTCVHGDTRQVPACRVTIAAKVGSWPVDVGIVKDLPVPVLLGRDWPGLDSLRGAAEAGNQSDDDASQPWLQRTVEEMVSPLPKILICSTLCSSSRAPILSRISSSEMVCSIVKNRYSWLIRTLWRVTWEFTTPLKESGTISTGRAGSGSQAVLTSPRKPSPSPLIPLAIIEVPLERDRVMVLVPNAACKFLATWQGPYTVLEKVGPVTYRFRQPGRRQAEQLYHVNLLKRWVGTRDQLAALAHAEPAVVDTNPHLSPTQKKELQHLVGQFSDVFSPLPGQTNIIQHEIRTPPGVIVRQRPYRVPEARRQAIEEEVQQMLKLGVIELPIVMVPKPNGTLRFCNDFRRLNEVSEFDGYPMPRVD